MNILYLTAIVAFANTLLSIMDSNWMAMGGWFVVVLYSIGWQLEINE